MATDEPVVEELPLRVGDLVTFLYGVHPVEARVVEDRGPLGTGGARILRVRVTRTDDDPVELELPEAKLELLEREGEE